MVPAEKFTESPTVFVATMGLRPEVITLALDELWPSVRFDEICIIHTASAPDYEREKSGKRTMHRAIERLDAEFTKHDLTDRTKHSWIWRATYNHPTREREIIYRRLQITHNDKPVRDVETSAHSAATFRTLHQTLLAYKRQNATIHCCIAGGRKSMAVSAMSVGQLLFDQDDRIWHLVSEDEFAESDVMHELDHRQSSLIPIRTVTLTAYHPAIAQLIIHDDPLEAIEAQEAYVQRQERHLQDHFYRTELNDGQRRILQGLASGWTNDKIVELTAGIVKKTISNQIGIIYDKYMDMLGLPHEPGVWEKRTFLAIRFHDYFTQNDN